MVTIEYQAQLDATSSPRPVDAQTIMERQERFNLVTTRDYPTGQARSSPRFRARIIHSDLQIPLIHDSSVQFSLIVVSLFIVKHAYLSWLLSDHP
jgi:hypothetical protein